MEVLFVTATRIGDAVLSTGILAELATRYPHARFTVACGPIAAPLFAGVPGLERVIALKKKRSGGHWLSLWRQTVTRHWDLVVDLRASAIAWLLWTRARVTYRTPSDNIHRVVALSRAIGSAKPCPPKIWTTRAAEEAAAALITSARKPLALGPTTNWKGKQWPADRFAELAIRLVGTGGPLAGAPVIVLGGPGERPLAQPLLDALPADQCIDLIGKLDLLTGFACLSRASLFIGNDSGLMHLAAAAGIPTLGLFGPSREVHYAPFGPLTATVRGEPYEAIIEAPTFDPFATVSYMTAITVDAVYDTACALLARAPA